MASNIPSQRPFETHTLGGQTRLLSHHLTGYFTWKVISTFCSIPPLSADKVRKLSIDHRFDLLLAVHEGWRVSLAQNYLEPFLKRYLPGVIEEKLLKIEELSGQNTPFPKELIHESLKDTIAFYDDVESAARMVAKENFISTSIDNSMEKALTEIAKNRSQSEELLLSLSIQKLLNDVVCKAILSKTPALLEAPMSLVLQAASWTAGMLIPPLLKLASPFLPHEFHVADETIEELIVPLRMIGRDFVLKLQHELEHEWRHPTHPRLGLDRDLLKRLIHKQIKILQIGDSSSQDKLENAVKSSSFQDLTENLQDKFIFDDVCRTIEEIMAVAWNIAKRPSWRKEQVMRLFGLMNDSFIAPGHLLKSSSAFEQAMDDLVESVAYHKLSGTMKAAEKKFDKHLAPWFNWPFIKDHLSRYAKGYFGTSIHNTALDHLVPLACKAHKQVMEKVVKFWRKPYSLRYGVLHRHLLMRWLKA